MGYLFSVFFIAVAFFRLVRGADQASIYFIVSAIFWVGGELSAICEEIRKKNAYEESDE